MSWQWKVFWCWPLIINRAVLIVSTGQLGTNLLFDTGKIMDTVVNALAIVFVLDIDKLFFDAFVQDMSKDMLARLEPFEVGKSDEDEEEALENFSTGVQFKNYSVMRLLGHVLYQSPFFFCVIF